MEVKIVSENKAIVPALPGYHALLVYHDEENNDYFTHKMPVIAWLIQQEEWVGDDLDDMSFDVVEPRPITADGLIDPSENEVARAIVLPDGRVAEDNGAAHYKTEQQWIDSMIDKAQNDISDHTAGCRMNLVEHLCRQREFSLKTFGPGKRTAGICAHIRKELDEIERNPNDLEEWIDVVILGFDGAWRTGASPEEIAIALINKQVKNENREWPDWRDIPEDKAIEHVKK